jgi:hypothetical protein
VVMPMMPAPMTATLMLRGRSGVGKAAGTGRAKSCVAFL